MHAVRLSTLVAFPLIAFPVIAFSLSACAPPSIDDSPLSEEGTLQGPTDRDIPSDRDPAADPVLQRPRCIPPAAFLACAGVEDGQTCSVTRRDGSTRDGICRGHPSGYSSCAPLSTDNPAIAACGGRVAGDACRVTTLDGRERLGFCRRGPHEGSPLACMPPLPPGAFAACDDREPGTPCTVVLRDGNTGHGMCRPLPGGLACTMRLPPPPCVPPPALFACDDLAADAPCTFEARDGSTREGACRLGRDGASTLVCAPSGLPESGEPEQM